MLKSFSVDLAGCKLTVKVDRAAAQASGAAFMHYGDTVVLSTATASSKPREGIGSFPFSVEYEERLYSVGEIPGGFNKREGKASENAVLTRHVINRPMRPLFLKDYRNDVALDNIVMCVNPNCSPELTAVLGFAIVASISDILFAGPCAITQVGLIDGEFIINPTADQKQVSDTALTVVSTREKVIMIETGANKVLEQIMTGAIFRAHEISQEIIKFIDTIVAECGKEEHTYESCAVPEGLSTAIREIVTPQEMEETVFTDNKQAREKNIAEITAELEEALVGDEEWLAVLGEAVYQYQRETVHKMILKDHKRPDGRVITETRHLVAEVDLFSRVHGLGMFTRGQIQVLNACTLAPPFEAQKLDSLDGNEISKRYMHHYNFPSSSVGETKPSRGPGRREIGHDAPAERALIPVLSSAEEFPHTIRTVSETIESNGFTSQVSICASILSLMATGVLLREMVAGISRGLVIGDTDDDYLVLTDIQGLGDFFGDMDFKAGGTKNGITAIQMDIKTHGLTRPIIEEAIARTRGARMYILNSAMRPIILGPRKHLSPYIPKIKQITIDPQEIGNVVGKQGKIINKIIEETGVEIGVTDDGAVNVYGTDEAVTDKVIQIIIGVVTDTEVGMIFNDKVVRIINFGVSVELAPNKDDMIHISKLSGERVGKVEGVVNIGDEVTVKVTEVDKVGRTNLTMRPSDLAENKTAARIEEK